MTAPYIKENWMDQLNVVAVISNYQRYRTRYDLYEEFEEHMLNSGVTLWTTEVAFGDRSFAVTQKNNPRHLRLRTTSELWHKENMINLTIQRFPNDWKYVAWIDVDVEFARFDWAEETVHQLQHYPVVQLFSQAVDLGPNYEIVHTHRGFAYNYNYGSPITDPYSKSKFSGVVDTWHPGYAWAMTRYAYETVGGLLDTAIVGAADRHMAAGIIGMADVTYHSSVDQEYKDLVLQWQERALRLNKDLGYVEGLLLHNWHGKKRDRRYYDRWRILVDNNFTPSLDLIRDYQGLWRLTDRNPKLRDDLRNYGRVRNEDSIDVD